MATRGDLITRVMKELHLGGTSYTTQVTDALTSAVRYYQGSRFWFNEGTTEFTVATAGTVTLSSSLPDSIIIDKVRAVDDNGDRYLLRPDTLEDFLLIVVSVVFGMSFVVLSRAVSAVRSPAGDRQGMRHKPA